MRKLWSSQNLIILGGLVFGSLAVLMTRWGNPPNMGICVACFIRDIAGALGLHRNDTTQYIRPEVIGFLMGAFATSLFSREFRPRGGGSPLIRFFLGAFMMVGAMVFLGCPIRLLLRIAGGDLNGITGLVGMVSGVLVGVVFLKKGFNIGRAAKMPAVAGLIMPAAMVGLLLLAIFKPSFIFASEKGPGSLFAPLGISLAAGLAVGFIAQRTRFCSVGGWRDLFLAKDTYLFRGLAAFLIAALITNYALGNFADGGIYHWGFDSEPIAHSDHLWNFLGMSLVGLAATLAGGCPLRNLILSGEGDTDAGVTVLGLFAGGAFAHNFLLASSTKGASAFGPSAVIIGLIFCLAIGFFMRQES